jgi:uncharacterized protein
MPSSPPRTWLVLMHGNAGTRFDRMPWYAMLRASLDVGIVCWDYRGYGGSSGSPSQKGFYADGDAVNAWLDQGGVIPAQDRVCLYGESIGTSVCVHMATQRAAAGLVLHAPPTSVADAGQDIYWFLPVKWLTSDKFPTIDFIRNVKRGTPKLVIHGTRDEIVPFEHGERLFRAMHEPKVFAPIQHAGHNDIPTFHEPYMNALRTFVESLE